MTVKLGHFEVIQNTQKPVFSHAKDSYIAGYVCAPDGSSKTYIMFADSEFNKSCKVVTNFHMELGHMYRISQNGKNSYLLSCMLDGEEVSVKLSESRVRRALSRTANNPEDIKELCLWDRLFK